jgi:hypothetical protein
MNVGLGWFVEFSLLLRETRARFAGLSTLSKQKK